jgi:hypothetical protein
MLVHVLVAAVLAASPKIDSRLVGTWNAGGSPFCTLKADGTGRMEDGPFRWSAQNGQLRVVDDEGSVDVMAYSVEGDSLTLNMGGIAMQLSRAGGGKAAKADKPVRQPEPRESAAMEPPKPAGNDSLSRLLVSSAWCSFSYSKTSGVTHQSKVRFFPNGTWSSAAQAETYASGSAGTYASQSNDGSGGRWAVKGGRLYMSNPPETPSLEPVEPFSVTKNSSGYPIINADGREYSSCN